MSVSYRRSEDHSIEPLHPTIGAVLGGVNARRPLDQVTVDFVRQALLDYKVVFLRNQHVTLQEQERFGQYFGDLLEHPINRGGAYPDIPWLESRGYRLRAENWHSDLAFLEKPALATILTLAKIPPVGGDTLFADLEAAYNGLAKPVRDLVDGLTVLHDAENFTDWAWGPNVDAERRASILDFSARKVEHPLVKVHPETGRKTLFAARGFARKIKGLSDEESDGILSLLAAHVTKPEYVVRFKWGPGDIAFWDNRATLHRLANDYGDAPRVLQRITLSEFAA
jgi:taurine dioxygenase